MGNTPGLLQGDAVVSQDSGHDNAVNIDPAGAGGAVFGTDPVARRDYGHAALPRVATAAKSLIGRFYGAAARHGCFFGCSRGRQDGMAFAQRYPDMFAGIAAAFAQCPSARILPGLRKRASAPGAGEGTGCIAVARTGALARSLGGPRAAAGRPLHVDWPWDLGIGRRAGRSGNRAAPPCPP